jgi:hypothetical protein
MTDQTNPPEDSKGQPPTPKPAPDPATASTTAQPGADGSTGDKPQAPQAGAPAGPPPTSPNTPAPAAAQQPAPANDYEPAIEPSLRKLMVPPMYNDKADQARFDSLLDSIVIDFQCKSPIQVMKARDIAALEVDIGRLRRSGEANIRMLEADAGRELLVPGWLHFRPSAPAHKLDNAAFEQHYSFRYAEVGAMKAADVRQTLKTKYDERDDELVYLSHTALTHGLPVFERLERMIAGKESRRDRLIKDLLLLQKEQAERKAG